MESPLHFVGMQDPHMPPPLDPDRWLAEHGDYLYRYARRRLRDSAAAEDAVQETLLAAWRGQASFSGGSSERTWLTGILRHKIVDYLRKIVREQPLPETENGEDPLDALYDARGHWQFGPQAWGDPDAALERSRFWQVFEECLERLPPRLAAVFVLREVDGMASDVLCKELNISTTNNVWVMLSRARAHLRACLETRWFGGDRGE